MGTLYINQEDAFIGKVDERIVVKCNNKILRDVPLIHLDAIVILGRATVSPAAIAELLHHKISLTFISEFGEYLGTLEPELTKNIFVRNAHTSSNSCRSGIYSR
jgi:CRISP-associated protein Cas1